MVGGLVGDDDVMFFFLVVVVVVYICRKLADGT